jgi:hypothetical protein
LDVDPNKASQLIHPDSHTVIGTPDDVGEKSTGIQGLNHNPLMHKSLETQPLNNPRSPTKSNEEERKIKQHQQKDHKDSIDQSEKQ